MAVAPLIRVLPSILRLFPQFKAPPIVRGKVIPLQTINEATNAELERALNHKIRLKKKEDFNDNSRVVKVEDVRKIYEEIGTKKGVVVKVALDLAASLITEGAPGKNYLEEFGNDFMDKVREKVLKQTAARKRLTYRYSKREI